MTKYGYARVSTARQELDSQVEQINAQDVELDNIYKEKITGSKKDRPQLINLLNTIQAGDTVLITKIDRLARSIIDLKEIIEQIRQKGVTVSFLNDNLTFSPNSNNANSNLMLNMLASFAEFERDLIVSRMEEGKAHAKRTNPNYREGRPKRRLTDRYLRAVDVLKENSYAETEKITGLSKSTLQRIKKQYISETGNKF